MSGISYSMYLSSYLVLATLFLYHHISYYSYSVYSSIYFTLASLSIHHHILYQPLYLFIIISGISYSIDLSLYLVLASLYITLYPSTELVRGNLNIYPHIWFKGILSIPPSTINHLSFYPSFSHPLLYLSQLSL